MVADRLHDVPCAPGQALEDGLEPLLAKHIGRWERACERNTFVWFVRLADATYEQRMQNIRSIATYAHTNNA